MSVESATVTLTRTITAAAGVFAPGHLGELTRFLPFDLVDAVLAETVRVQQRLRDLPSRVVVYFVIALSLFPRSGYLLVWGKLVAGLSGLPLPTPSEAALRHARRRLGAAPLRALFDVVAGPSARPDTPGVTYRGLRTVAFDGCSSFKTADTPEHRHWLGKVRHRQGTAGYPQLMLMAMVETGSRALLGARFGALSDGGEPGYASRLPHLLDKDMLVLLDRGFNGNTFLADVAATGAHLLVRLTEGRRPPVETPLPDGSYLTHLGDLQARVIEAEITTVLADGTTIGGRYRLATTLTDHHRHPAATLTGLYHERWEIESAFYALRHTLFHQRVLRSATRAGLHQELWGLLILYQLIRTAITEATEQRPGTDPDRASFTIALANACNQLINAAGILPDTLAPTRGGSAATDALPARRDRASQRKVKSPISRYAYRPTDDPRPAASTAVTTRIHTIWATTRTPPPKPRTRPRTSTLTQKILNRLHLTAGQPVTTHDIADHTGIDATQARYKLADMVNRGDIIRTRPGHFTTKPPAPTPTTPTRVLPPAHSP
ncbi:IS4 family transposase [Actinoplanes sp. DH11]|uniref:IS4 family transposase n=1 Tax=Actinoplanes sp. DH11 TaxID=2857011 RepID=UPI001E43005C|nr:IS4 family transposase [Actinoplanes sp. DH11]